MEICITKSWVETVPAQIDPFGEMSPDRDYRFVCYEIVDGGQVINSGEQGLSNPNASDEEMLWVIKRFAQWPSRAAARRFYLATKDNLS